MDHANIPPANSSSQGDGAPRLHAVPIDSIIQDPEINQSNVWQIIDKPRQTVNQLLKINSLPRTIKTESASLSIPKTILIELSQLSDEDEQLRLWEQAKEGRLRVADIRKAKPRKTSTKQKSGEGASKLATVDQATKEGEKFFGTFAELDPAKMNNRDREKLSELATALARNFSSLKRRASQSEGADF